MQDPEAAGRLFRNARREAIITLCVLGTALVWVLGYCYLRGYRHEPDSWVVRQGLAEVRGPEQLQTVVGFPDWFFWGIVIPWLACTAFTVFFGVFLMTDDDLGGQQPEGGNGH